MLSPAQVASMQATLALRRTETATVLRTTFVAGTQVEEAVADYPCRRAKDIIPPRLTGETEGLRRSVTSVVFGFAVDADVRATDRLQVGPNVYEIQGLDEPNTVADLERLVHCLKKDVAR